MPYVEIDPILNPWASRMGVLILEEDNEIRRRYFHTSSSAGETFQVVIEPEQSGTIRIDAHLIETWSDAEVHYIWEVSTQELRKTLDVCADTIKVWFSRGRDENSKILPELR